MYVRSVMTVKLSNGAFYIPDPNGKAELSFSYNIICELNTLKLFYPFQHINRCQRAGLLILTKFVEEM